MPALDNIKLIGVSSGVDPLGKPAWVVTMGYYVEPGRPEPMLSASWHLRKADHDEADLVRVARHYFQGICQFLAEETEAWEMSKGDLESLKKGTRSPSDGTANTA